MDVTCVERCRRRRRRALNVHNRHVVSKMIRPRATRALAINGLTITATISRDDETIFKKCGQNLQTFNGTVKEEEEEDCKYHVTGEDESLEWEKWKKRREHYDKKKTNGKLSNLFVVTPFVIVELRTHYKFELNRRGERRSSLKGGTQKKNQVVGFCYILSN